MLDPEGVIELLNEFPESFDEVDGGTARKIAGSEMYFSSDGQPTDAFLEALKKDWNLLPKQHIQISAPATKSLGKQNLKVKSDRSPYNSKEEFEQQQVYSRPSSENRNREKEINSESDDSNFRGFAIRQPRKIKMPRNSSPNANLKKKKQHKQKRERKAVASAAIMTNNPMKESAASALINSIISAEEVEQDAVRKSLQLRVAGQLNCIKLLQTKLKQSLTALQQRDTRLVQLEAKLKIAQEAAVSKALDIRQQQELQGAHETIDRLKKQLQQTEDKLQEETARRLRSEERGRSWKEQADKHKTRSTELEQKQTVDQNELSRQLTATKKYKSAAKELAAELAALRATQERNEQEASRRNETVELAQQRAYEAQLQVDRLREEIKHLALELHQEKHDKRDLALQLQVAREKQVLISTEHRLQQRMRDSKSLNPYREISPSRTKANPVEPNAIPHTSSQRSASNTHSRKIGYRIDHDVVHRSESINHDTADLLGQSTNHDTSIDQVHSVTIQHIKEIAQRSMKPLVGQNVSPQDPVHYSSQRPASNNQTISVRDHAHSDNISVSTTGSRLEKIYSKLSSKGHNST